MVIPTSTSNTNPYHLQNNNQHLRNASFSSYLNSNEETFAESTRSFNPFNISNTKDQDGEIGVFEAAKYFNGGYVENSRVDNIGGKKYQYHEYQKEEQTALESGKYKVQHGTPSVRSESSMNSQSALLQNTLRNSSRNGKNKVQIKSFLAGLGCKCSCADKDSVDISSDHAGEISFNKSATYGVVHENTATTKKHFNADLLINKDVCFQNPEKLGLEMNKGSGLVFSTFGNQLVKRQLEEVEKPRKSLEVFGSPILDSRSKSLSFDKRLTVSMPSWDAAPKMEEINFSANCSGGNGNYNDADSDASSDLFEIESLTAGSNLNTFLARPTSSDVVISSGCASPTNCYAPSEASIEWSVVTASAVEYSEDQRSVATIRSPIRTSLTCSNAKPKLSREMQRRRPGMLLGCNSHKAVGVAGDAFTATCEKPNSNSSQIRRKSDTFPQVTRFHADTKQGNFGARNGQHAYASHLLHI